MPSRRIPREMAEQKHAVLRRMRPYIEPMAVTACENPLCAVERSRAERVLACGLSQLFFFAS